MSEQGKQAGQRASEHLQEAQYHVRKAGEMTKKAGDAATTKKLEKINTDITTTKTDLDKSLSGPKQGG